MRQIKSLVGGEHIAGSSWLEDVDPSTGEPIASVAACTGEQVDLAVAAARRAFEHGPWASSAPKDRGRVLRSLGDLILQSRDELAHLESSDTGKPLRQAVVDVDLGARYFEFYGCAIEALHGGAISAITDVHAFTSREPLGVTAHIEPWNYPLQIGCRTLAPALAVGNCCVLKPAEEAPLSLVRLSELALEAGLPPGGLNVVTGTGADAGAPLAAHPDIDHLSFTGSVEVGAIVAAAAAANVTPASLELGGKSPNIVFADANLSLAIPFIVRSILQNAGQTCSAGSRLLVHRDIHAQVVNAVADAFANVRIGPASGDADLGPLISAKQLERVERAVSEGASHAQLRCGGRRAEGAELGQGFFFEPTLIDEVDPDATLAQEEVFGPVLAVMPFGDEDEAISIANGTRYGLIAAIWTQDIGRAHRVAKQLRCGQVYVNTYGAGGGVELPFGGVKRSGYGREKGFDALLSFTQTKTIIIDYGSS